jgi:hypothetical protein
MAKYINLIKITISELGEGGALLDKTFWKDYILYLKFCRNTGKDF